jgi:hypothetical protein
VSTDEYLWICQSFVLEEIKESERPLAGANSCNLYSQYCEYKKRVTGGWRKLHNEELHNLNSLSDIVRVIESRRMKWCRECKIHGGNENFT